MKAFRYCVLIINNKNNKCFTYFITIDRYKVSIDILKILQKYETTQIKLNINTLTPITVFQKLKLKEPIHNYACHFKAKCTNINPD